MASTVNSPLNPLGPHGAIYTDQYELTMAQGYFKSQKHNQRACFDYFFRKVPCEGGDVVFSGIDTLLEVLLEAHFSDEALAYLSAQGFDDAFLEHLREFRCQIDDAPKLKISENPKKVNFPGLKNVLRLSDRDGQFCGDCVVVDGEHASEQMFHPFDTHKHVDITGFEKETILRPVMQDRRVLVDRAGAMDAAEYAKSRLTKLPDEHKRFQNPHIYKVGLSQQLRDLRDDTVGSARQKFSAKGS